MTLEQKKELLNKWKESGLSLPKWWKENADKLDLPHLSTLYSWVKQVGFSTEPGVKGINEHNEEQEERGEVHDEREDLDVSLDDSQEEDDKGGQDESQGFGKKEEDDDEEKEADGGPEEEDVIAKERIEKLAPVTVPEPAPSKKPADTPKMGIKTQTWFIIGGAVILGIGAYVLINKIGKRKREQKEQNTAMRGGNPFGGYVTVDEF